MDVRNLFSRRVFLGISISLLLIIVGTALFLYMRAGTSWSYVEKMDGTMLFGKAELLSGGFIELRDVYGLVYTEHLQGNIGGGQFQIESLNPKKVTVSKLEIEGAVRIGPNEVRQWGSVPADSEIGRLLRRGASTTN